MPHPYVQKALIFMDQGIRIQAPGVQRHATWRKMCCMASEEFVVHHCFRLGQWKKYEVYTYNYITIFICSWAVLIVMNSHFCSLDDPFSPTKWSEKRIASRWGVEHQAVMVLGWDNHFF